MTGSIKSPVEDCKERVEHHQKKRSDGGRLDLESMDQACWHEIWWCEKDQNCSLSSPKFAICCAGGKVTSCA